MASCPTDLTSQNEPNDRGPTSSPMGELSVGSSGAVRTGCTAMAYQLIWDELPAGACVSIQVVTRITECWPAAAVPDGCLSAKPEGLLFRDFGRWRCPRCSRGVDLSLEPKWVST